jgi:Mrp family chromosome partitioning ATPase
VPLPGEILDACRRTLHSIRFETESRLIGVTSPGQKEGKTSVALGIALAAAADTGEPTVLIECDYERPAFAGIFGIAESPGLAEWADGDEPLRPVRIAHLDNGWVIPSGNAGPDPGHVFYRLSRGNFADEMQHEYRNVVLDLPSMVRPAYSRLASRLCDRVLLVARHGVTPMSDLREASQIIGHERLAGVVLNGYASRIPDRLKRLV